MGYSIYLGLVIVFMSQPRSVSRAFPSTTSTEAFRYAATLLCTNFVRWLLVSKCLNRCRRRASRPPFEQSPDKVESPSKPVRSQGRHHRLVGRMNALPRISPPLNHPYLTAWTLCSHVRRVLSRPRSSSSLHRASCMPI